MYPLPIHPFIRHVRGCLLALVLTSCGAYKQNILFQTDKERIPANLVTSMAEAEKNYVIQKNDYLDVQLYANGGEKLIDLNVQPPTGETTTNVPTTRQAVSPRFLVESNGFVRLPMVGAVQVENLTLSQADSLLEKAYAAYFEDPFVRTTFGNKRVFVLGAVQAQVVPLVNENMNLIEVLAMCGGVANNARVRNIRLIRGDLRNPEVRVIDLSTVDGMTKSNLKMQANDIVYVEPVRKVLIESISDITPVIGLFSSVLSIVTLIVLFNQQ